MIISIAQDYYAVDVLRTFLLNCATFVQ